MATDKKHYGKKEADGYRAYHSLLKSKKGWGLTDEELAKFIQDYPDYAAYADLKTKGVSEAEKVRQIFQEQYGEKGDEYFVAIQPEMAKLLNMEVPDVDEDKIKKARSIRPFTRDNGDGTESSLLMSTTEVDGKYYAHPTLFPKNGNENSRNPEDWDDYNKEGLTIDWDDSNNGNVRPIKKGDAFLEAKSRGEIFEFDTAEEAEAFAKGSWKPENDTAITTDDKDNQEKMRKAKIRELEESLYQQTEPPTKEQRAEYQKKFIDLGLSEDEANKRMDSIFRPIEAKKNIEEERQTIEDRGPVTKAEQRKVKALKEAEKQVEEQVENKTASVISGISEVMPYGIDNTDYDAITREIEALPTNNEYISQQAKIGARDDEKEERLENRINMAASGNAGGILTNRETRENKRLAKDFPMPEEDYIDDIPFDTKSIADATGMGPDSDEKTPMTVGDQVGIYATLFGTTLKGINTYLNKLATPEYENYFDKYAQRAMSTLEGMRANANRLYEEEKKDIRMASRTSTKAARDSGRSINEIQALNFGGLMAENIATGKAMQRNINTQMNIDNKYVDVSLDQDKTIMGERRENALLRGADIDNYYTNRSSDIAGNVEAFQNLAMGLNQQKLNQDELDIQKQYGKYVGFDYDENDRITFGKI